MKNLVINCTVSVNILMLCILNNSFAQTTVSGLASYKKDGVTPLVGISILLYDMDDALVASTETDNEGYYEFAHLPHGEYLLTGSSSLPPGEINIIDAIMVAEHIEGVRQLEGLALLAADVDGDGEITWADYNYILVDHLVYGYPFPVGDWVFERLMIAIDSLMASPIVYDVGGNSTGDTKVDIKPDDNKIAIQKYNVNVKEISEWGQAFSIEVNTNGLFNFSGYLIGLTLNMELFEIVEVICAMPDFGYGIFRDHIVISAASKAEKPLLLEAGEALVRLKIKPRQPIEFNDIVYFKLSGNSHFVDGGLSVFTPSLILPALSFNFNSNCSKTLLTAYPNPAKSHLTISYTLANDGHATLSIYSPDGKPLRTLVDSRQKAGKHELGISRSGLPQGLYLLRLTTNGESIVRYLLFSPE